MGARGAAQAAGGGRRRNWLAAWLLAGVIICAAGCVGLNPPKPHYEPAEGPSRRFWAAQGLLYEGYGPNDIEPAMWAKAESGDLGWEEPTLESLVFFLWPDKPDKPQAALFKSRWSNRQKDRWSWLAFYYEDTRRLPRLEELWRIRSQSPDLVPLALEVSGRRYWFVLSGMYRATGLSKLSPRFFPNAQFLKTEPPEIYQLEIYDRDPRLGFVLPRRIWELGHRQAQEGGDVLAAYYKNGFYVLEEEPLVIAHINFGVTGGVMRLEELRLEPWPPLTPEQILQGAKVGNIQGDTKALLFITRMNNKRLLEWKTKELAEALPTYPKAQLQDMVVKLEAALLELDSRIKKVKDSQDEAARYLPQPGQAAQAPPQVPQWQVEQAHLFAQRKAIVIACLEMVKKALAQRRGNN